MLKTYICQNPKCTRGEHGEPKKFEVCPDCVLQPHWKAIACCVQCYQAIMLDKLQNTTKGTNDQ